PPPTRPTSATWTQPELLTHFVRSEDAHVHPAEDRDSALDELRVRREDAAREVEVVLEADAHVAADDRGEGGIRKLHPPDRERREDAACRQLPDEREERPGIVRGAVGDAHAELDQNRVLDQALGDHLLDEHELPGVEDLELRSDP